MPVQRILVLHSVLDAVTSRRISRITGRSTLKNYEIRHCYATQNLQLLPSLTSQRRTEYEADLERNLNSQVKEFSPDLLVVHFGSAFLELQDVFVRVLARLKTKYSGLRIGIEDAYDLEEYIPDQVLNSLFEQSDEVRAIIKLLL